MDKAYTRVNFENLPSHQTPLSATNLNIMDKGIDDIDDRVIELNTNIESLDKSDVGLGNVDNTADLNKPISRYTQAALDEKTDVNSFNALTQEIELFNTYDLSNDVEISVFANDTYKRDKYDRAYETHVPNLDGEYSVSLGDKTFTETCTFTIANEGTSITEVFHTNRKYILGAKLLKAENDEVGDAHVIADVVTLIISKDAPYTTTFDPYLKHPPVTGVLTLKVSVKPDEKYVNTENTGGPAEYAYWGSYSGWDLMINNPILTYSETTFGQPKVSGNPITINDAAEANAVDVSVNIEPIQDLHGYDHPWVGGAGKNLLKVTGETTTINGVTFTVNDDGTIKVNGTATADARFSIGKYILKAGSSVRLNGSPVDGSNSTIALGYQGYGIISTANSDIVCDRTSSSTDWNYDAYIKSGYTASNLIFKPMIRLESVTDPTFEPYSNISPITGQTEVVIEDCGKNLIGKGTQIDGLVDITTMKFISTRNGHGYYFRTADLPDIITMSATNGNRAYYAYFNEVPADNVVCLSANQSQKTLPNTITVDKTYKYIHLQFSYGQPAATNIQVEVGSTPTEYEPYKGKTYTIQLKDEQGNPITVYGGSVDVVSGKLRVTHGEVDLGDLAWVQTTNNRFYAIVERAEGTSPLIYSICSAYSRTTSDWSNLEDGQYNYGQAISTLGVRNVAIRDTRCNTISDFKTAVTGQTLVYELATPYTIQLTPQQIRLLKGTNNISCNTGDLSIKYYPDNVLGQLKGDIESEYDDRVETLETQVQELQPSLIFMSRERRDITSDLSRLSTAVVEQNLAKYGYKIGDYFTGASRYTYILADYNTFKGTSTPYCLTQNHLGIVVDTHTTSQWYSGDASSVGYNGSTLHTYLKDTVMNNIKADMIALFGGSTGLEHLLSHSKLLTTALANWGWQSTQYISALSEVQVSGSRVWGANGYQTGEAAKKLELFDMYKWTEIFGNEYPWLRDMYSASSACNAGNRGAASIDSVTYSYFAVGLINFY